MSEIIFHCALFENVIKICNENNKFAQQDPTPLQAVAGLCKDCIQYLLQVNFLINSDHFKKVSFWELLEALYKR